NTEICVQLTSSRHLSWEMKIKKRLKTVPPCLGKFRPTVGQCCHQCTPDSLRKKLGQTSSLGFRNLLSVDETHTRYRGWLVRRVCCALFVSGCKVYASPVSNRLERVCQSNRYPRAKAPLGYILFPPLSVSYSLVDIVPLLSLSPVINFLFFFPLHLFLHSNPPLARFLSWVMLKMFSSLFCSVQVNLNHLPALHRGSLLMYVYVRQSAADCALIPLVLFCHNLRVPYTVCPLHITILQKVGVILLPPSAATEQDAEMDSLYSPIMTSLVHELLHEGQAISVGVSAESGQGGRWLAHITQLIKEGSVPDVSLVPVGISYDCGPFCHLIKTPNLVEYSLLSFHRRTNIGWIRHSTCFFCLVDKWLPLQDLLLPVILNNRTDCVFGRRRMSWLLPSSHYASELNEPPHHPERDLSIAVVLHLIFCRSSIIWSTLAPHFWNQKLLHPSSPPQGVSVSALCRDVAWLTEELLFRNKDVGFGGVLEEVVRYSLSLLAPHLIVAAVPSRRDPSIVPRPSLAASLHLALQAQIVTHTFILEAVGACAVSAMLCEVVCSGVNGDMEFNVVLCQSELTERALQLCHLLPPGFMPPCQSSQSFALDAVDSLVRCGILTMEEIPRDVPISDFWKKEGALTWTTSDDPYHSDSDCDMEEQDLRSYKISQPSQCPEMLFFLSSMLAGHMRALCWATSCLDLLPTPLPGMYVSGTAFIFDWCRRVESCSEEAAHTAVRSLIDLGVSDSLCVCVFKCVGSAKNYSLTQKWRCSPTLNKKVLTLIRSKY
uniref:Glycerol-3-phosphate acyltransferase 2, mitochondrial n=1 Tax=Cyclopterus lumpus TaxID=8103 RepID=A0A8C2WR86_CYCLU